MHVFSGELGLLSRQMRLVEVIAKLHTTTTEHIPVSIIRRVKKELMRLEKHEVIATVDLPTDWNRRVIIATNNSGNSSEQNIEA